jgi:small subunit ribosomal protein S20
MPIIKSAKKRVKTAAKANVRNTRTRRDMREAIKAFNKALEAGKSTEVFKLQSAAVSAIDIAAKKNVIHKNKAARSKARLASQAKVAGVKPSKASPKSKVESRKSKTATKKAPAKKSATKKPTAKKTTKK